MEFFGVKAVVYIFETIYLIARILDVHVRYGILYNLFLTCILQIKKELEINIIVQ